MHSFEATIAKLRSKGFKMTPQRLAVIKHMLGDRSHPSALAIHQELQRKYPTLSFSTVYNTLNMLEKIDEIRPVHIFDDHMNYDPNTVPHMHFLCKECRSVFDIFTNEAPEVQVPEQTINGHRIDSYELIFKGICKDCL